jgi:hypothetical protein
MTTDQPKPPAIFPEHVPTWFDRFLDVSMPFMLGITVTTATAMPWISWWSLINARTTSDAFVYLVCTLEFMLLFALVVGGFNEF